MTIGVTLVALIGFIALFADLLAPYDYSEMIRVQPSSEVGYLRRVELYDFRWGYGPNLTVAGKNYGKAEWREDKKMVKELRK